MALYFIFMTKINIYIYIGFNKTMSKHNSLTHKRIPSSPAIKSRSLYTSFDSNVSQPVSPIKIATYNSRIENQKKEIEQQIRQKIPCDIDNFIEYILMKKQQNKNLSKLSEQIKQKINEQAQLLEEKQKVLTEEKKKLEQFQYQNKNSYPEIYQAEIQIQSQTSLIIARTFQVEDQLKRELALKQKKQYLEALFEALKIDFSTQEQQLSLKSIQLNQEITQIRHLIKNFKDKIEQSNSKKKSIQTKKEQIRVLQCLNLSSKIIFDDIFKITYEEKNPSAHSKESINMLICELKKKMEILQRGLNQCQDAARFLKRMEFNSISKEQEVIQQLNLESQTDILLQIYLQYLKKQEEINSLKIKQQKYLKKYNDLLSQSQLDDIRQKNTEVLYYLKKLEAEFKKKNIIISNLEKQLQQKKNQLKQLK